MVAAPRPGGTGGAKARQRSGGDHAQRRDARRNPVGGIVQPRGRAAKIDIARVLIPHHAIQRIHGLVGGGERGAPYHHVEKRRDHAVARVFRHGLNRCANAPGGIERGGVAPHDHPHGASGGANAPRGERTGHGQGLAPQLAGGEQLIAQIHLRRKAHDGRDGAEQGEDRPHEAEGRRGQAGCEHAARTAAPGGTIGKRGAQARFRP